MWPAINTVIKFHSPVNNTPPSEITPGVFNAHIVSVVIKFLSDDQTDGSQYDDPIFYSSYAAIQALEIPHVQFLLYLCSK